MLMYTGWRAGDAVSGEQKLKNFIYSSVREFVDPFLPMYLTRVDISDLSLHEATELIQPSVLVVFYYMTEWFPSRLAFIHYIPQLNLPSLY